MRKEIKLGLLAIVTIAVSIWGFKYLKGKNVFSNVKVVKVKFDEVANLEIASPVAIRGFKVGSVLDIEIDRQNVENIIVTFDIEGDVEIPKNVVAELKNESIMGGRYIELKFDNLCTGNGDCLENGDIVKGNTYGMLGSMISTNELDGYVSRFGTSVDTIMGKLGNMDDQNPLNKTIMNLEASMENLNEITEKINKMLSSTTANVGRTMENLDKISKNLADNNSMITGVLSNLEQVTNDIKKAQLGNTVASANSAIATTTEAISDIKALVNNTKSSIDGLNDLITKMDEGDGSMASLINDNALYDNLNSTTKNLDFLLQDLRLNPKRYVKVSVFGKKDKEPYTLPDDDPANQN